MQNYNYSTVENKTRLFLENLQQNPGPPLYTLTPNDAREVLSGLQGGMIEKVPAEIVNKTIPGGPKGEISIKIVRPQGCSNETLPVVMYFHGGGWILGGFDTHERLLRELAKGANAGIRVQKAMGFGEITKDIAVRRELYNDFKDLQRLISPYRERFERQSIDNAS